MELKNFVKIKDPKGSLKATFLAYIPEWDFSLFMMYFEKEDGSSWFGYPQKEYTNKQGEKKYQWLAFFGDKAKPRFEDSLKEKVKKEMNKEIPF